MGELLMEIDERKRRILWALIQDYIASAEPVGSRTLSRRFDLGVSPATIRNEMADLEEMGFIEQPYTSAGRIPSETGYRYYVDYLMEPSTLDQEEADFIRNEITSKIDEAESALEYTVRLVSRLTKLTSIAISRNPQSTIKKIHFLPYQAHQIIMLTIWDNGKVENSIVDIGEEVNDQELQILTNLFNDKMGTVTPGNLKNEVLREIRYELLMKKHLIDHLILRLEQIIGHRDDEAAKKVYYGGTLNMIGQPEFKDFNKIKDLFGIFEENKKIIDLVPNNHDGLRVQIGSENQEKVFQNCSLITATYHVNGLPIGSFGIIGPTRMDYGRIMAMVKYVSESLSYIIGRRTLDP
jgi:heat-inducible transcriptional repressor